MVWMSMPSSPTATPPERSPTRRRGNGATSLPCRRTATAFSPISSMAAWPTACDTSRMCRYCWSAGPRHREQLPRRQATQRLPAPLDTAVRRMAIYAMPSTVRIGTQGWNYDAWVGPFYPPDTRAADFLAVYSRAFDTVEIDSTFYAVPPERTVQSWAERTPGHFTFALKLPQEITHEHRLRDCADLTG